MSVTTEEAELHRHHIEEVRLLSLAAERDAMRAKVERPESGVSYETFVSAMQIVTVERDALQAENARLRKVLEKLVSYAERNECHHENTHRGGIIWTICDDCGGMWADDKGGLKPYCEPAEITNARAALGETQ